MQARRAVLRWSWQPCTGVPTSYRELGGTNATHSTGGEAKALHTLMRHPPLKLMLNIQRQSNVSVAKVLHGYQYHFFHAG